MNKNLINRLSTNMQELLLDFISQNWMSNYNFVCDYTPGKKKSTAVDFSEQARLKIPSPIGGLD